MFLFYAKRGNTACGAVVANLNVPQKGYHNYWQQNQYFADNGSRQRTFCTCAIKKRFRSQQNVMFFLICQR